jgi:hypothetical protein
MGMGPSVMLKHPVGCGDHLRGSTPILMGKLIAKNWNALFQGFVEGVEVGFRRNKIEFRGENL